MKRLLKAIVLSALLVGVPSASRADIIVPGADGSDGAFAPTGNVTIDLSQAISRAWDESSPVAGRGVYDYGKWAVVYHYSSVVIPANVTVTFKNHPSRAPVVWLVAGDVTISGTVNLDGRNDNGPNYTLSEPGPGGFHGGHGIPGGSFGSAGHGPGGGGYSFSNYTPRGTSASYAQQAPGYRPGSRYGNPGILPLIGGSGGSGGSEVTLPFGGGAGGGAILVAATGTVAVNGTISANGGAAGCTPYGQGGGGGSGGALRLVADTILIPPQASLTAIGKNGGWCEVSSVGRIRIEGNHISLGGIIGPTPSQAQVDNPPALWSSDVGDAPSVRIVSVGAASVSTDPRASLDFPGADATVPGGGDQMGVIEALNVPLTWAVELRMVPTQGEDVRIPAAFVSGNAAQSTWQATVPLPSGFSVLQVRAYNPTTAAAANADNLDANEPEAGQR